MSWSDEFWRKYPPVVELDRRYREPIPEADAVVRRSDYGLIQDRPLTDEELADRDPSSDRYKQRHFVEKEKLQSKKRVKHASKKARPA